MSFADFYTYNAEEWYAEEIVCSLCEERASLDNLQEIIVWASTHMTTCKGYKWFMETRIHYSDDMLEWFDNKEIVRPDWYRHPVAMTEDQKVLAESKNDPKHTDIRFIEREF